MPEKSSSPNQLIPLALDDESIHIYQAALDALSIQRPELELHLDPTEQDRAANFRRPLDRTRFITCRGQLREILAPYIGTPPSELAITYTAHGKPLLRDHPHCHFNVAHSFNLAVWAISFCHEIGIDIEQIRPNIPLKTLFPCALSEREAHLLHQHKGDPVPLFLQFWTRKEAFLKANGCGLSMPLHQIDASNPNGQISLPHSDEEWYYHSITTFPNCITALVTQDPNCQLVQHEL